MKFKENDAASYILFIFLKESQTVLPIPVTYNNCLILFANCLKDCQDVHQIYSIYTVD